MSRGLSAKAHSKVLESATELFAERGIDVTCMDAIAGASGPAQPGHSDETWLELAGPDLRRAGRKVSRERI